jgi:hypothetical protein
MATVIETTPAPAATISWPGRILSGIAIAFLLMDSGMKIAGLPQVTAAAADIGWPTGVLYWRGMGLILLACTALYAWPRTAVLGAILLTGWLGGAIATHLRLGDPLFTHTLFGVYVGLFVWGGLWLRSPALRALMPFTQAKD